MEESNKFISAIYAHTDLGFVPPTREELSPAKQLTAVNARQVCSSFRRIIDGEKLFYKNNEFKVDRLELLKYFYAITPDAMASITSIAYELDFGVETGVDMFSVMKGMKHLQNLTISVYGGRYWRKGRWDAVHKTWDLKNLDCFEVSCKAATGLKSFKFVPVTEDGRRLSPIKEQIFCKQYQELLQPFMSLDGRREIVEQNLDIFNMIGRLIGREVWTIRSPAHLEEQEAQGEKGSGRYGSLPLLEGSMDLEDGMLHEGDEDSDHFSDAGMVVQTDDSSEDASDDSDTEENWVADSIDGCAWEFCD